MTRRRLFRLALNVYTPALTEAPTSWLLFIKFTGGFYSDYASTNLMNGPGQVAIDERGYFWINDNYVPVDPHPDDFDLADLLNNRPAMLPDYIACAGKRLLKFYPWGEPYAGMPIDTGYTGGGLSGAGFGITLDPRGNVWVGNFGFEAPICADFPAIAAPHDSVSLFRPNGRPVSGPNGFTEGQIWWPQATMSDSEGNIWVSNSDAVDIPCVDPFTRHPGGDPSVAFISADGNTRQIFKRGGLTIPWGSVIDGDDQLWVFNFNGHRNKDDNKLEYPPPHCHASAVPANARPARVLATRSRPTRTLQPYRMAATRPTCSVE